jgi:hypothetical protein
MHSSHGKEFTMSQPIETRQPFVDRRNFPTAQSTLGYERRQFSNSHNDLTPDARELAIAVDHYKLEHRRRFVTYEELMNVVLGLGYEKVATTAQP